LASWALTLTVGATVAVACGNDRHAAPLPTGRSGTPVIQVSGPSPSRLEPPACQYPARIAFPKWVPSDLPLPKGTYATRVLPTTQGYNRGLFIVPVSLTDLARFVLSEWPDRGWVLGRGDSEPGEIDDQFTKPPAVGAFRAREQFCDPGYVLMLLIYIPDRNLVVLPTGSPLLTPSPSGSPFPSPSA
jgi:hypothetical protein